MNEINKIIDNFNMLISRNDFCFQDDNEFIENGITKEFIEIYRFMNEVSRGKSFTKMEIEYAPQVTKKYNADICSQLSITPPEGYTAIGE